MMNITDAVRADLTRNLEMALRLDAATVGVLLGQSLLQALDMGFKGLDVVQVFVLLSDFGAKLVVDLSLLVVNDVRVLLVEEYSGLTGCQERHRCLRALFSGNDDTFLIDAAIDRCLPKIDRTLLLAVILTSLEQANLLLLALEFLLQLRRLLAHLHDFEIQMSDH